MHRLGSSSLDVSQLDVCYVDPARVLRALEKGGFFMFSVMLHTGQARYLHQMFQFLC